MKIHYFSLETLVLGFRVDSEIQPIEKEGTAICGLLDYCVSFPDLSSHMTYTQAVDLYMDGNKLSTYPVSMNGHISCMLVCIVWMEIISSEKQYKRQSGRRNFFFMCVLVRNGLMVLKQT